MVSMIVAMTENRAIGINNELPWRIPEDLAYFKKVTMGKPIIMGRKTYESIGRALPGRLNVVVTRQSDWQANDVRVASSPEQAIEIALSYADEELMIIGGAEVYSHCLPLADKLYVTQVYTAVNGDAFFPELDPCIWKEKSRAVGEKCLEVGLNYDFVVFKKAN